MTSRFTADDFERAKFATHPDGKIAARTSPDSSCPWVRQHDSLDHSVLADSDMAHGGWVPVPAGSYTRTDEEDWQARAVNAEQALAETTAHRDQCRDTAIKWQKEANRTDEQLRPLDLFEKHRTIWGVREARREFLEQGLTYKDVRRIVELTFTPEPEPTRPEGAETLAFDLDEAHKGGGDVQDEADRLYAMGYRKTGAE